MTRNDEIKEMYNLVEDFMDVCDNIVESKNKTK